MPQCSNCNNLWSGGDELVSPCCKAAPIQKPKVHYKIIDPNEDNILLSKREFINAWNKWGSLNPHTLWNLLKTEAK